MLASGDVDDLFVSTSDIWEGIKDHYNSYKTVPTVEIIQTTYRDFEPVATDSPTKYYVDKLRNDVRSAKIREIILSVGTSLAADKPAKLITDDLVKHVADLTRYEEGNQDVNMADTADAIRHFERLRARAEKHGGTPGIRTGFRAIDTHYPTGFAPGNYVVIIGWPGRGKSWFSGLLAVKAYQAGYKPMFVTAEMSPREMQARLYNMMGSGMFQMSDFQTGAIDLDEFRTWGKKTFDGHPDFPVVTSGGKVTSSSVLAKIERHKPDIVFCDYMQLMGDARNSNEMTDRMGNLSVELKELARSAEIPVVAISAVTKENGMTQDAPPMLHQVRWAKSIEYDADLAMAVHKYDESDSVEVISRKNRHGPDFGFFLNADFGRGILEESYIAP